LSAFSYLLVAVGLAGLFLSIAGISLWKHKKSGIGRIQLVSAQGLAQTDLDPEGTVLIAGELWQARSFDGTKIAANEGVEVLEVQGHLLLVKR
jgi:membrane-bound serine protease (ClpP class)